MIKTQLANMLIEYDSKVTEAQNRGETHRREVDGFNIKAIKNFKDHLAVFKQLEVNISKGAHSSSCLWLSERRYLQSAITQVEMQKAYAQFVKHFWMEFIQLEHQRIKEVKNTMINFVNLHNELFVNHDISTLESLEAINEDVTERLNAMKLATEEEMEILKELGGRTDPLDALIKWSLPMPSQTQLTIRQVNLEKETGVMRQWKTCFVVVTVDKFMHVFAGPINEEFQEPVISFHLLGAKIGTGTQEELTFEVIEAKSSGLLSRLTAAKRCVFKVSTLEELKDWVELLKSLTYY